LQRNPARGTLLIAGFADSLGSPEINRRLALERAEAVRNALLGVGVKLAADRIEVKGYGEIAPVACNDTEAGRSKNRRVEIWLRP
jgi:Outer membrane protein and related peptidoglycan-associated (lipo)proteins